MGLWNFLFRRRGKNDISSTTTTDQNIKSFTDPVGDWKTSAAHLLLLGKFLHSSSTEHYVNADYWEPVLKEKPAQAIARFIKEQMLEPLDLLTRIHLSFNISDLKGLLKERKLKVSGNKTVLIERLLENDPLGIEKMVADCKIYKCTIAGESLAQAYAAFQNNKKKQLEEEILRLLREHQFKKALQTIAIYESSQVFSRGVGMDWEHYGSEIDLLELAAIFEKTPKILRGMADERLGPLRTAAGMVHLFGTNRLSPWLPAGYETGIRFDSDTAGSMLLSHARYHRRLSELGDIGDFLKEVEYSGLNDDNMCPTCKKLNGRKFKINNFPELPYSGCTNPEGCKCSMTAVFKH